MDDGALGGAGGPLEVVDALGLPVGLAGVDLAELALVDPELVDVEAVDGGRQGQFEAAAQLVGEIRVEAGPGLAEGEEVDQDPVLGRRQAQRSALLVPQLQGGDGGEDGQGGGGQGAQQEAGELEAHEARHLHVLGRVLVEAAPHGKDAA